MMGAINEEALLRNEYLLAENKLLRRHVSGGVKLDDKECSGPGTDLGQMRGFQELRGSWAR